MEHRIPVPFEKPKKELGPQPQSRKETQILNDDDRDSTDEEDALEKAKRVKDSHEDFVADFKNKIRKVPNSEDPASALVRDFYRENKDFLESRTENNETLLHFIAGYARDSTEVNRLGDWLLKIDPNLLLETDKDHYTPLHTAFRKKTPHFTSYALKSHFAVDALKVLSKNGNSCFHAAFDYQYPGADDLISVITRAGEDTTKTGTSTSNGDMPNEILDMTKTQASSTKTNEKSPGGYDGAVLALFGTRDRDENTPLHLVAQSIGMGKQPELTKKRWKDRSESLITSADRLIEHYPDALFQRNKKGDLPYHCTSSTWPSTSQDESHPAAILRGKMKLHFMRGIQSGRYERTQNCNPKFRSGRGSKINHDWVIKALYADTKTEELKINFDISRMSNTTISTAIQKRLVKHFKFEDPLLYVHLPNVSLEDGGKILSSQPPEATQFNMPSAIKGRVDALKILHWLRRTGMREGCCRKILEVTVEDDGKEPHSDEAIEWALAGLEVEKLNWKRFDLCSDVIPESVTEVYLYSSGNNAVLRGWTCESGLPRLRPLQKLKKVHLCYRQGLEARERVKKYADRFVTDLEKNMPDVEVMKPEPLGMYGQTKIMAISKEATPVPKNTWLEYTTTFANFLQNSEKYLRKPAPDVKVAIIDDGIDFSLPVFDGPFVAGTSFFMRSTKSQTDRILDYYVEPGSHGTDMATLVCQICPYVKLYVVRLGEGWGRGGERQIQVDSAVKAIEWARRQKVDIISISWSIKESSGFGASEQLQELRDSVKYAYDDGITIFCAASDLGPPLQNREYTRYPAKYEYTNTIGAAEPDGRPYSRIGIQDVDFLFPGTNIMVDGHIPPKSSPKTGSSFATAIAAGLAALIHYCVGVAGKGSTNKMNKILTPEETKQIIKDLCSKDPNVPEVSTIFGDIDWDLLETPDKLMEKFQTIADKLQGRPSEK